MAGRSPARSTIGEGVGVKSAMEKSPLADVDEGFPKSPMRDEYLGNISSDPNSSVRSSRVSRSSMKEGGDDFGFVGVSDSSARVRNVSKSPMRERGAKLPMNVRSIDVTKSPLREERTYTEFDEGLPKSPMRERFLNDLGSIPNSPMGSRGVSRSPLRERGSGDFDFDVVGESPTRSRNVSKSPLRERGAKTATSVRTRNVARSPLRERRTYAVSDGVSESPARSMNEDIPESPMRRDYVSESDKNAKMKQQETMGDYSGMEEEVSGRKMELKTSFSSWVHGDKHMAQPDGNYSGMGRRTWRDRVDKADQISEGRESVYSIEHGMTPEASVDNLTHVIDPSKEKMHTDMRFWGDYVAGYGKSRRTIDQWVPRKDGVGGIHGTSKLGVAGRILASSSSADGCSNYPPEYIDGYGDSRHSFESLRGPASIQDLELEHAILLRKYKELKHQLSDMEDERFSPAGFYRGSDDYLADESWRFRWGSVLDKNLRRPRHFHHGPGPAHHMADTYNFAPYLYDDPFSGQVTRAPRPNPLHTPGRFDLDSLESYNDKAHYHHPACSCSLCYANDWQDPDLPDSLSSGVSTNFGVNHRSSHSLNIERNAPRAYMPRMPQSTLPERPSYLAQHHHKMHPVTNQIKRLCYPISGGAPFVLCKGCFRLLKLPKKLMSVQKIQHQLQCGACTAVMSFDLQNRSSALPSYQKESDSVNASSGLDEVLKESGLEHHRNSCAATSTNLGSYDFDAVRCGFQSVDSETCEASKEQRSGVSVADSEPRLSPSSSHSSKDLISDNASVHSGLPNSAEMPLKTNLVRPQPGSPLRDHFYYSTHLRQTESGEVTCYTVEEKQITEKDAFSESSAENTMVTTEIDVHSSEVTTSNLSQDSWDVSREEDKVGNSKDKKSSISTFMKWGFASRAGLGSPGQAEVSINGQPIQHHLVKRAEKLAGPIQPGDYWYDSKAGFWGVMGRHCLGIIPPFIPEFSFAMPRNCSGGDTAVCINGRELRKRDLDLLATRGLPTTTNKSYIIDISGKVLDEETKEFIANLGKLAPTVEKKKRGFGMQVPDEDLED